MSGDLESALVYFHRRYQLDGKCGEVGQRTGGGDGRETRKVNQLADRRHTLIPAEVGAD